MQLDIPAGKGATFFGQGTCRLCPFLPDVRGQEEAAEHQPPKALYRTVTDMLTVPMLSV